MIKKNLAFSILFNSLILTSAMAQEIDVAIPEEVETAASPEKLEKTQITITITNGDFEEVTTCIVDENITEDQFLELCIREANGGGTEKSLPAWLERWRQNIKKFFTSFERDRGQF